jgi:hypothetical protein
MAHQWRRRFAPLLESAISKSNGALRAPLRHWHWRANGANTLLPYSAFRRVGAQQAAYILESMIGDEFTPEGAIALHLSGTDMRKTAQTGAKRASALGQ